MLYIMAFCKIFVFGLNVFDPCGHVNMHFNKLFWLRYVHLFYLGHIISKLSYVRLVIFPIDYILNCSQFISWENTHRVLWHVPHILKNKILWLKNYLHPSILICICGLLGVYHTSVNFNYIGPDVKAFVDSSFISLLYTKRTYQINCAV